jgi:hypothetical protein
MSNIPSLAGVTPPIFTVITELADCLCDLLVNEERPVCWCGPEVGAEVPFDNCFGDCGTVCGKAWVRIVNASPFTTFPTPDIDAGCGKPLMYSLEVGVMRCIPTDDQARPEEIVLLSLLQQLQDERACHRALLCCAQSNRNLIVSPQQYIPRGPEGGCVGGIWNAVIGF